MKNLLSWTYNWLNEIFEEHKYFISVRRNTCNQQTFAISAFS